MKASKLIGSVALTAALAMGTVPAFAANQPSVSSNVMEFDNSAPGETEIVVKSEKALNEQCKATVPIQVVVVMDTTTGQGNKVLCPDKSSYKITNTGKGDIKVSDVQVEENASSAFEMEGLFFSSMTSVWGGSGNSMQSLADRTPANFMMITYNDGTNHNYLSPTHGADKFATSDNFWEIDGNGASAKVNATGYTAPTIYAAANASNGNDALEIQLDGVSYCNTAVDFSEKTDTLCKIKYTIIPA